MSLVSLQPGGQGRGRLHLGYTFTQLQVCQDRTQLQPLSVVFMNLYCTRLFHVMYSHRTSQGRVESDTDTPTHTHTATFSPINLRRHYGH